MLIGVRPDSVFGGADVPAKMAICRAIGYDFLELPLTADEIAALTPQSAMPWLRAITDTGLPILSASMGHFRDFAAGSPATRTKVCRDIRAMIALTHALGADVLLLATSETGPLDTYIAVYREALSPLADEAAAVGVTLALEHVAPFSAAATAALVRALGHSAIRVYFDTGNCLQTGEDPLAAARDCAPVTAALHLKHGPTTPLGAMPLREVREILTQASFGGRSCLEILNGGDTRERPLWEARGLLRMTGYQ